MLPQSEPPRESERDGTPFRFYDVVVNNRPIPALSSRLGRQPAWSCQARLDVFGKDGEALIEGVVARWSSQPEPRLRMGPMGMPLFDRALCVQGERCDIHGHKPEPIVVALKEEGDADWYLFSNDSYQNSTWNGKKPEWRLPQGNYRLRVTLLFQRAPVTKDFNLVNGGTSLDDLRIEEL